MGATITIFIISILLQFAAVILAFRLIRTTGWQLAWSVIAFALLLMGARRSISFYNLVQSGVPPASYAPELVALSISALMVIGVALIGPLFSAKQRVEKALRQSEENLRAMAENSNDGILVNMMGKHVFANHRMASMLGYELDELQGTSIKDVVHPDEYDKVVNRFKSHLKGNDEPNHYETLFIDKKGRKIPVEISSSTTLWQGQPAGLVAVRDVSQRIYAQRALAESEERYRATFEQTSIGITHVDLDGHFMHMNRQFCEITGYSPKELARLTFKDITYPDDLALDLRQLNELQQGKIDSYSMEKRYIRKGGGVIWVNLTVTYLRDSDGAPKYYIAVVQDINDRKLAEEKLHRAYDGLELRVLQRTKELTQEIAERKQAEGDLLLAKDEAENANKAKTEFLSHMSHELRTPLNAIIGFGQLLESDPEYPLAKTQLDNVHEIIKAGHHLLHLINEVLDLARIETGKMHFSIESVSLDEVLLDCITMIQPLAEKRNIKIFDLISERDDCVVYADRHFLKQVLINLISNAVKYNRDGGTVTLSCELAGSDRVRINVSDTGEGITPEQQQHLFQPFERLEKHQGTEGVGIGLVVCKRLVEAMDGNMGIKSVPGQGATFWVEVGKASDDEKYISLDNITQPQESLLNSIDSDVYTVLYIEDNLTNLRLVAQLLKNQPNIKLLLTQSPEHGLEIASMQNPDLILLDINLPGMSGYEVLDKLRTQDATKDIPAIAISANAMPEDAEKAYAAGFEDYITKPIDAPYFYASIERTLNKFAQHAHA